MKGTEREGQAMEKEGKEFDRGNREDWRGNWRDGMNIDKCRARGGEEMEREKKK